MNPRYLPPFEHSCVISIQLQLTYRSASVPAFPVILRSSPYVSTSWWEREISSGVGSYRVGPCSTEERRTCPDPPPAGPERGCPPSPVAWSSTLRQYPYTHHKFCARETGRGKKCVKACADTMCRAGRARLQNGNIPFEAVHLSVVV